MPEYEKYISLVRNITSQYTSPPLAYIHSYGCRQNVSDGEKIAGMLSLMGYGLTSDENAADIILLNTCAVRENAETRVFGNIGALKHLKEQKSDLIIGLCGCMAQEKHVVEKLRQSYGYVELVFGTFALRGLPKLLYDVLCGRKAVTDTNEYPADFCEDVPVVRGCSYKADVPIMFGCNKFCTYCIVPYVRGREHSREPEKIISEIRGLVGDGCREIMLLGQNVDSYRAEISFPELLRRINDIDGDFRVRFMSPHPRDATPELMDTILECKKICNTIHLPLQSGSDRILKAMNRGYTSGDFMKLVRYVRDKDPDFSITTDIIVGFPNESEEDFEATLDILRQVRFDNIYSFIYSKRVGTRAAMMEDSITDEEKSIRFRRMLELQREISTEHYKRFVGRTMRVLFENESRRDGYIGGKSDESVIVEARGSTDNIGQFRDVKITAAHNWAVDGEIV